MKFNVGDLFVYSEGPRPTTLNLIGILIEIDELNDIYTTTWQREKGPVYQSHHSKVLLSVNVLTKHYEYFPVKS